MRHQSQHGKATATDFEELRNFEIEFETNGSGWLGYISELPGAFVRGTSESECLGKVSNEIGKFIVWLGSPSPNQVVHRTNRIYRSSLCVEDADNEILLEADRSRLAPDTFESWKDVARQSGECFQELVDRVENRTWRDPARIRTTFLGECPSSVEDVYKHVDKVQQYYQDCLGIPDKLSEGSFTERRRECLARITDLYGSEAADDIRWPNGEGWTIAKALRRYIWHDRIHAKSIIRSLRRQQKAGLIDTYVDPFHFGTVSTALRTDLLEE